MIRTRVLLADGHVQVGEGLALARTAPAGATVWVDVIASTAVGLAVLPAEWRFHHLALEDCIHEQRRSKYERFPAHAFVVVHALNTTTVDDLDTLALRIFVRPGLVVSVHERPISAVDRVETLLREDAERIGQSADRVLYALIDSVVDEFMPLLDRWEGQLDALETRAESHREISVMDDVVALRRNLLVLRRLMLPQQEVVKRLMDSPETTEAGKIYFRDVLDHMDALADSAQLLVEVCHGMIQVQVERVNERLNKTMKYMAIVSTLLLPMTVISGVFGMNFDVIPNQHSDVGFYGAVAMMVFSAAALMIWFRQRKWV